jgi:hypothetical protein
MEPEVIILVKELAQGMGELSAGNADKTGFFESEIKLLISCIQMEKYNFVSQLN